ncbi:hypothetical protein D0469_02035 [Peribacillus saganii]|uniref:Uncharacterized protein n=1 Tax=Peribacillus saganii TaxID=2303992 RepID=A0A372LUS0_9BACI|nr:hypothetical protein [Peribacillus saganii]RFU71314.1 hypothetical protein D0469_02035 [Peribacillus saganii]
MSAIVIAFSIILNVITIFAVIILYLRQNRLASLEQKQLNSQNEIEEILAGFMMEMKEENEQLVAKIKEFKKEENQVRTGKSSLGSVRIPPEQAHAAELRDAPGQIREHSMVSKPISASKVQVSKKKAAVAYKTNPGPDKNEADQEFVFPVQTEDLLEISSITEEPTQPKDAQDQTQTIESSQHFRQALQNELDQHKKSESVNQSAAEKAVLLYKQGKSIENIAKKLNKGKTEVELLLKFHR